MHGLSTQALCLLRGVAFVHVGVDYQGSRAAVYELYVPAPRIPNLR